MTIHESLFSAEAEGDEEATDNAMADFDEARMRLREIVTARM